MASFDGGGCGGSFMVVGISFGSGLCCRHLRAYFFHCRPLQHWLSLWALTLVAASALALSVVVSNEINGFISVGFCDGFVHWRQSLFIYV